MIIKTTRRGGFKDFSDYLAGIGSNANENEEVNFVASDNTSGVRNINDWCIFANNIVEPRRRLKKPIEHISIRTRQGDILRLK